MKVLSIVILTLTISFAVSKLSMGNCPNHEYTTKNFDVSKYFTGKWYEIVRDKGMPFQKGDCTTAEYEVLKTGKVSVNNTEVYKGKRKSALGEATPTTNPNKFEVVFGDSIFSKFSKGDYQVMHTDYDYFSVVYSCTSFLGVAKAEFVWILSRHQTIDAELHSKLVNYIESELGYDAKDLRVNDQSAEACKTKN